MFVFSQLIIIICVRNNKIKTCSWQSIIRTHLACLRISGNEWQTEQEDLVLKYGHRPLIFPYYCKLFAMLVVEHLPHRILGARVRTCAMYSVFRFTPSPYYPICGSLTGTFSTLVCLSKVCDGLTGIGSNLLCFSKVCDGLTGIGSTLLCLSKVCDGLTVIGSTLLCLYKVCDGLTGIDSNLVRLSTVCNGLNSVSVLSPEFCLVTA